MKIVATCKTSRLPRRGAAGERRSRRGEAAAERRGGGTETHSFCAGRLELSRRTVSIPRRVRLEDTARRLVRIAGGEALGGKHSRRSGGGGGGRRVGWRGGGEGSQPGGLHGQSEEPWEGGRESSRSCCKTGARVGLGWESQRRAAGLSVRSFA